MSGWTTEEEYGEFRKDKGIQMHLSMSLLNLKKESLIVMKMNLFIYMYYCTKNASNIVKITVAHVHSD